MKCAFDNRRYIVEYEYGVRTLANANYSLRK